jgi:hypothetical protein
LSVFYFVIFSFNLMIWGDFILCDLMFFFFYSFYSIIGTPILHSKREMELTSPWIFWSEHNQQWETNSLQTIWKEIFTSKFSCENWWDSTRIHSAKTDALFLWVTPLHFPRVFSLLLPLSADNNGGKLVESLGQRNSRARPF